ncbi:MAG: helix-turn-helix transcriptional regulator [Oligoflexia bacterium]|nr:helix-turn-helix transcriptional regulator [Oligoflexia bacterium]
MPFRMWAIVRDISKRKEMEIALKRSLKEKNKYIKKSEDYNISLKTILTELTEQRKKTEEKLYVNISENIIPILHSLKKVAGVDNFVLRLIEERLFGLVSNDVKAKCLEQSLTMYECKIIDMIKREMRLKEIASELNISENTIHSHIGNIRKKLGIRNKKINLKLFIKSSVVSGQISK